MNKYLPLICGIVGPELSESEVQFIKEFNPWGVIIFDRNCKSKNQLSDLTDALRAITHDHLPIIIDHEGGRVSRINYSNSIVFKSARFLGDILEKDIELGSHVLSLHSKIMALSLREVGICSSSKILEIKCERS